MIIQDDGKRSRIAEQKQRAISSNSTLSTTPLHKSGGQPRASADLFTIISLWAENNPGELRPRIDQVAGDVCYTIEGYDYAHGELKEAERKGLLRINTKVSFSSCPKCQSHFLQAQMVCPDCKFQALEKSDLLIHYECQHSGPIAEFRSPERDSFFCPKCSKDLKRVGIDYGNPGIGFKCSNCDKVFQFPLVLNHCNAGHICKIDELDLRSYPVYVVGDNALGLSMVLVDSRTIQSALQNAGIECEIMVHVRGSSGTNHLLPMLAVKVNGEKVAIEFIPENLNMEQTILQLLLKSADLENTIIVLISKSTAATSQIRQIANPNKVKVIDAKGIDEISDSIIREIVS
jgi:hypothetical protein